MWDSGTQLLEFARVGYFSGYVIFGSVTVRPVSHYAVAPMRLKRMFLRRIGATLSQIAANLHS